MTLTTNDASHKAICRLLDDGVSTTRIIAGLATRMDSEAEAVAKVHAALMRIEEEIEAGKAAQRSSPA